MAAKRTASLPMTKLGDSGFAQGWIWSVEWHDVQKCISGDDPSVTIRQIAKENQKKEMEVLGLVFR
ncbi:hypothetical protein [Chlorobium limicola]